MVSIFFLILHYCSRIDFEEDNESGTSKKRCYFVIKILIVRFNFEEDDVVNYIIVGGISFYDYFEGTE